jgi:steroid delta-isomerase-like uncharacterized protein
MSEQENIQMTRRVFEVFNNHNPDAADQMIADDLRSEATGAQGMLNKEQNRMYNHRFFDAFPDIHFDVQDIVAQGDRVAATWMVTGTHKSPLALPTGDSLPATNRNISVPGCTVLEFRGNKISHQKIYWDQLTFLMQLGVMTEQDMMSRAKR